MPKKKKKDDKPVFSVHIPDNIKKQGDKADALMQGDDPGKEPKDPGKEPKKPEPTNPEPPRNQPADPPKPADPNPDDWRHKYDVLRGKYDSETAELRESVHNLTNLVAQQSEMIENLAAKNREPAAPAQAAPVVSADFKPISTDDFVSYGDEIVALAEGFNQQQQIIQQLSDQLKKVAAGGGNDRLSRVEKMVHRTASDKYMDAMDQAVPKWREINNSSDFKGWLGTVDPVSGYRYNEMLRYAVDNLNHDQAIAIFKRYAFDKQLDLGEPKASASPDKFVRDSGVVDRTVDPLESQLMPDDSTGGSDGSNAQQKGNYPTIDEFKRASDDCARGRISMEEFKKISDRFQMGLRAAQQ